MHLTSSRDYRMVESLINKGPRVIMLVYSTTCPHCVSYMPIWKRLCKTQGKKAHMVSMEHSVYSETPLAAKKSVSGVPTVLFVDPKGGIHEETNIRDETNMTNAITSPDSSATSDPTNMIMTDSTESAEMPMLRTSELESDSENESERESEVSKYTEASRVRRAATPYPTGTASEENPLSPLPATPIHTEPMTGGQRSQRGGDPWSAFVAVARQAAPAAALLAAYGMLPFPSRSSGLGAAKKRRSQTRRRSRSRRHN